tara:strand:+ start:1948 stop:3759 length:1812 start_codon:yes stop_codon:yes gene_type:complete
MCAIFGLLSQSLTKKHIESKLKVMSKILDHRGPDGNGIWVDDNSSNLNVGLGHNRLSIIDLTDGAKQPMSLSERFVITFNGEIYNYIELKEKLIQAGINFKSNSDTEVLLHMYAQYGEDCLDQIDGMFAFAIWDKIKLELFCARDRFGEKPFYYNLSNGEFTFSSEIKGLISSGVSNTQNEEMVYNYLFYNKLHDSQDLSKTFYSQVKSLPPAHVLKFNSKNELITKKYWRASSLSLTQTDLSFNEANLEFQKLFSSSLSKRLRSDVKLGASLSGGLDSSFTVSMINRVDPDIDFSTFSAKFPGFIKDESKFIDIVRSCIDSSNYDCFPREDLITSKLSNVLHYQDEPILSPSILVQYDVMKLANENAVKVIIDGQGADEYLAGYTGFNDVFFKEMFIKSPWLFLKKYKEFLNFNKGNKINKSSKRILSTLVKSIVGNKSLNTLSQFSLGKRLSKNGTNSLKDYFNDNKKFKFKSNYVFQNLDQCLRHSLFNGDLQDLLRFADRNSMANSVETRLPFLNHELVDFVLSLPSEYKFKNGYTKALLREAMKDKLPNEIIFRKEKVGYETPKYNWQEMIRDKKLKNNSSEQCFNIAVLESLKFNIL